MPRSHYLLDRMFQLIVPGVVDAYRPPPVRLADGVWLLERRLRMPPGALLPTRTVIVRLASGGLAMISAPPPHEETFAAIDRLGHVEVILAPNSFHHLYVPAAARRYPQASLYLAPGLQERVAALPPGGRLAGAPLATDFAQSILATRAGMSEVILFHHASRSLILTDCAFNLGRPERLVDRVFWRLAGVPRAFGPSRTARMTLLASRGGAAAALRPVLTWPFERIVVAHGDIVDTDARDRFARAFARYL